MKSNPVSNKKIAIPEGHYVEQCTPGAGKQRSQVCKYDLAYFKLWLNAGATINFRDASGNAVNGLVVAAAGEVPFLMSEITSTGGVQSYIVHDGLRAVVTKDMTSKIYVTGNQ